MTLPSYNDHPITNAVIARAVQSGVSAGVWRVKVWLAGFACLCVVAIAIVGCANKGNPVTGENPALPPIAASDTAIGKAESDVTGIKDAGVKLEPHVAQPGIPLLAWMQDAATRALENLSTAKAENANAKAAVIASEKARDVETRRFVAQIDSLDKQIAKLKRDPFYVAGQWIRWGFWFIVAWIGVAFVLRIAALFIPGWTGASLAKIAVFMFGVVTGGLSWFTSWADNAYMDRAAKLNPQ